VRERLISQGRHAQRAGLTGTVRSGPCVHTSMPPVQIADCDAFVHLNRDGNSPTGRARLVSPHYVSVWRLRRPCSKIPRLGRIILSDRKQFEVADFLSGSANYLFRQPDCDDLIERLARL